MTAQNRMTTALFLSLLLHLALVALLQGRMLTRPTPPEDMLDVDLVQLPPPPPPAAKVAPRAPAPPAAAAPPESSIVPMPDSGIEKPSDKARFASDRDNTVERETVKRGNSFEKSQPKQSEAKADEKEPVAPPEPARAEVAKAVPAEPAKAAPAPPAPPAPPAEAAHPPRSTSGRVAAAPPARVASLPKLDQLLPRVGDLAVADGGERNSPPAAAAKQRQAAPSRNLLAGRPNAFSSRTGVAAYLPTVQEGDITLLNTKASQFAPFVRRVAARVFQHLEIALRQAASMTVAGTGHEYAEVEAVMSPSGEFVSSILRQRKSETQLSAYRMLLNSANPQVFFDRNPPSGAVATDGNIHFLLMIDLNVDVGVSPESGRRGTSYYGVAGVGLE